MSSNHPAITVRGLSKSYTIRRNAAKHTTLADAVVDRIKHPFRRAEKEVFWALRDVNFEVAPGEIVGIIGRNGAGKSTLLKILSRITRPTSGEIELRGRVGSLLEVGTGFHQELTGRENIYLSGTILGMKHREIKEQFDPIVDFAGIEQFLDTPVKRYSSGMYIRLAFGVAAHLNSEILLIDEVLAVGDVNFQSKCLGKMAELGSSGRTVLFVSHNISAIRQLCTKAILFNAGKVQKLGNVDLCLDAYLDTSTSSLHNITNHAVYLDKKILELTDVKINGNSQDQITLSASTRSMEIVVTGTAFVPVRCDVEIRMHDRYDSPIGFFGPAFDRGSAEILPVGTFYIKRTVQLPRLNRGIFHLHIALADPNICEWVVMRHGLKVTAEGTPTATGQVFDCQDGHGSLFLEDPTLASVEALLVK